MQDLPDELIQDPTFVRSQGADRGRDGCRIPLPWTADRPSFGFSPPGSATPWLPQPADWAGLSAHAQHADPDSVLNLYRSALAVRRARLTGLPETLTWSEEGDGILSFGRDGGFRCVANLSAAPLPLAEGAEVVLSSGPLNRDPDGRLTVPGDTCVWL